jgi:hypothetical protein
MKIQTHIWPILIGIALVFGVNTIEHTFMPVVKDFVVNEINQTNDRITMNGWMRKQRNCSFDSIIAEAKTVDNSTLNIDLVFRDGASDKIARQTGAQSWGPWTVDLPVHPTIKEVKLTSVHRCHPIWTTTTELVNVKIQSEELFANNAF